ncbi:MAG: hypothetical protein JWR08_1624 [Enterovirga sp.]|jgi:MFS family permease|nr:hypothetical protein [Enterovirga sp.]
MRSEAPATRAGSLRSDHPMTSLSAPPEATTAPGTWIAPLVATLVIQTAAAFLTRLVPTIAPAFMPEVGMTVASIGLLAAVTTAGSIIFLLSGSVLIAQVGPIRSLQIGLGLGILGLGLLALPFWQMAVLGSVLIGLGYGPSSPAGTDVLHRYAPERHRNLIFSIKQAGVPLGGVLAGVTLPPIVESVGWRASVAFSALAVLATIALVQPLRNGIDVDRRPAGSFSLAMFLSPSNLLRPLTALRSDRRLPRLAVVGACLAFAQGAWFAFLVTYAVSALGYSLVAAGIIFGVMQATGVFGRVLLGWASDRLGSSLLTLRLVSITAAATSAAAAASDVTWPVWAIVLLAGIGGVTVSSWNGIQIAAIARLAPKGLVGETAAGATIIIFIGHICGPTLFAILLALSGGFMLPFLLVAAVSAVPLLVLARQGEAPAASA